MLSDAGNPHSFWSDPVTCGPWHQQQPLSACLEARLEGRVTEEETATNRIFFLPPIPGL